MQFFISQTISRDYYCSKFALNKPETSKKYPIFIKITLVANTNEEALIRKRDEICICGMFFGNSVLLAYLR